jgi:L-asparaginase / beta-aspartyl-peptidase
LESYFKIKLLDLYCNYISKIESSFSIFKLETNKCFLVSNSVNLPILVVHGGAGTVQHDRRPIAQEGVKLAIDAGWKILEEGGSSLDAVQESVRVMEDYPHFNAGKGSVLTADGKVEMDAMIMDGSNRNIGGVIGVSRVQNPILLSRKIMDNSFHVLFYGKGAEKFAIEQGFELINPDELVTDRIRDRLKAFLERNSELTAESVSDNDPEQRDKYGTVGAVAIDKYGKLAAATSTGGVLGKKAGRVGDTPIIGAGTYADDEIAVSGTGVGEFIMRYMLGMEIKLELKQADNVIEATNVVLNKMKNEINGSAGVIVVTKEKGFCALKNTPDLIYAYKTPETYFDFMMEE